MGREPGEAADRETEEARGGVSEVELRVWITLAAAIFVLVIVACFVCLR